MLSGRLSGYPPVCLLSNARRPLPHCPPIHSTHPPKSSRLSPSHHTSHHINESTRQACTCSCSTSRLVLTPNSHTRPPSPCPATFGSGPAATSDKRQECSDKKGLDYLHHSPALVTQTYVCALSTSSLPISRIHASTSTFRQRGLAPLLEHQEREPEQSRALPLPGSTTDHRPKPNPSHDGITTTAPPRSTLEGFLLSSPAFSTLSPNSPSPPPLSTAGTGQATQPRCPHPGWHPALCLLMLLIRHPFLH